MNSLLKNIKDHIHAYEASNTSPNPDYYVTTTRSEEKGSSKPKLFTSPRVNMIAENRVSIF